MQLRHLFLITLVNILTQIQINRLSEPKLKCLKNANQKYIHKKIKNFIHHKRLAWMEWEQMDLNKNITLSHTEIRSLLSKSVFFFFFHVKTFNQIN